MLTLDHIVFAASDLSVGAAEFEAALGVPLAPGGSHEAMGTHNRLLSLGPDTYLEVIAIDPDAPRPDQPRWYSLDRFQGTLGLSNWAARVDDLDAALAKAPQGAGHAWDLTRGALSWRMAVPEDGELPFDNCYPALLQWQCPPPMPALPDQGVRLTQLTLTHPNAVALRAALSSLTGDTRLSITQGDAPKMEVTFSTPNGPVTL